jgi:hypothetical protein
MRAFSNFLIVIGLSLSILIYANKASDLNIFKNTGLDLNNVACCKHSHCYDSGKVDKDNFNKLKFIVCPLGNVDKSDLIKAQSIIKNFYGFECRIGKMKKITSKMYYNGDQDTLDTSVCLDIPKSRTEKTIYIVDKKLYYEGQMLRGAASLLGSAAIVRGEESFLRETLIHEIGHLLGL